MSGWLVLTQLGLAPNQKHQALLGAPKIVHCGERYLKKASGQNSGGLFPCQVVFVIASRSAVGETSQLECGPSIEFEHTKLSYPSPTSIAGLLENTGASCSPALLSASRTALRHSWCVEADADEHQIMEVI